MTWKKGQSGNPSGMRPGSYNQVAKYREMLASDIPEIIRQVASQAKAGDMVAAKLILDRVWAPLKPTEPTNVFDIGEGSSRQRVKKLSIAVSQGKISVSEAVKLSEMVLMELRLASGYARGECLSEEVLEKILLGEINLEEEEGIAEEFAQLIQENEERDQMQKELAQRNEEGNR